MGKFSNFGTDISRTTTRETNLTAGNDRTICLLILRRIEGAAKTPAAAGAGLRDETWHRIL